MNLLALTTMAMPVSGEAAKLQNEMKRVKLVPHDSTDSRESIELDEYSDEDVEDEVFLKHAQNGDRSGDRAAAKPLMKKRRRKKNGDVQAAIRTGNRKYRRCCGPFCWLFMACKAVVGIMVVTIVLVNYFTHENWYFWNWSYTFDNRAPCHDFQVISVWSRNFPKLLTRGSIRLLNVSNDDVLDVVFGFGTGADGYNVPDVVCDIYFAGQKPCMGGVIALDGKTGDVLWTRYAEHEIFSITCQGDLSGDKNWDCVAGGRAGVLMAIDGQTGAVLWEFDKRHAIQMDVLSVYAAQFVHDLNGDGVPDVFAVHGGDELSDPAHDEHLFGRLILFSGKTGEALRWMPTPDRRESYYPPQLLTWLDGEQFVIFGTGGSAKGGSMYVISLYDMYKKNISQAVNIYHDDEKGLVTPAVLVDLTLDGIDDIVVATFGGLVVAFDGRFFTQLWNATFPGCETYSSPAVGFFDDDDVPDVLVKYQHGHDYQNYDSEQTVVLSGKNGTKISEAMINSIGTDSSPLTLSVEGRGNDVFLHWTANCHKHLGERLQYSFPYYVPMQDRTRADVCQQLFGVDEVAQFTMFQRYNSSFSRIVYDSQQWHDLEHANVSDTSRLAAKYLELHPQIEEALNAAAVDESEEAEDGGDGEEYSVLPYFRKDFEDKIAELQKVLEPWSDQLYEDVDYVQDDDNLPLHVAKKPSDQGGELVPDIAYSQPHRIHKYKPELNGQQDTFEYPYVPEDGDDGTLRGGGYGRRRRGRRETTSKYWGVHKAPSTGTLAPPLLKGDDSMDIVVASHWIYPAKVPLLHQDDLHCVTKALPQLKDSAVELEEYQAVVESCLKASGHFPPEAETYETPSDYKPLSVNMGQLSIYRFTVRCQCKKDLLQYGQTCGRILPYEKQGWPSFMGFDGQSKFNRATAARDQSAR